MVSVKDILVRLSGHKLGEALLQEVVISRDILAVFGAVTDRQNYQT